MCLDWVLCFRYVHRFHSFNNVQDTTKRFQRYVQKYFCFVPYLKMILLIIIINTVKQKVNRILIGK